MIDRVIYVLILAPLFAALWVRDKLRERAQRSGKAS